MKHQKNDHVTLNVKMGRDPVRTIVGTVIKVDRNHAMLTVKSDDKGTEYTFGFDAIVDDV